MNILVCGVSPPYMARLRQQYPEVQAATNNDSPQAWARKARSANYILILPLLCGHNHVETMRLKAKVKLEFFTSKPILEARLKEIRDGQRNAGDHHADVQRSESVDG